MMIKLAIIGGIIIAGVILFLPQTMAMFQDTLIIETAKNNIPFIPKDIINQTEEHINNLIDSTNNQINNMNESYENILSGTNQLKILLEEKLKSFLNI